MENFMAKKKRPSLSAMDEFDLEAKIQQATQDGLKTVNSGSDIQAAGEKELPQQKEEAVVVKEEVAPPRPVERKVKKPLGRPKKNPYPDEKKLTLRMPESLHRQLRFASADTGKPMVEIAIDALIQYLEEYKKR